MCSRCCAVDVAEPSPPTPITSTLPADLLARIVSLCDSPLDIVRTAAVSHLFRDSVTEDGIRLRAQERGYEALAPAEGERCRSSGSSKQLIEMKRRRNQREALGSQNTWGGLSAQNLEMLTGALYSGSACLRCCVSQTNG